MSKRVNKNVKVTIKSQELLADLTPVHCTAVTAFRVPGSLLAKSVALTIVNGVVTEVEDLTPAENITNIVISKAVKYLWKITKGQNTDTFLGKS